MAKPTRIISLQSRVADDRARGVSGKTEGGPRLQKLPVAAKF